MVPNRLATGYMPSRAYRSSVFVLYQLSLMLGIVLLPVALAAERVGFRLPIGRVVDRLGEAYDRAAAA